MATGGLPSNTIQDDMFTCGICLEHMGERNPRLLSCHHSFCENCLRKLLIRDVVTCPTCRCITPVLGNDITTLSMNFYLLQVKERDEKKIANVKPCQFCRKEKAVNLCEVCSEVLCIGCTEKHNTVEHFKDHVIKALCEEHQKTITHICIKCCTPACVKCIMDLHHQHQRMIKEYEEGLRLIEERVAEKSVSVDRIIEKLSEENLTNNDKIHKVQTMRSTIEAKITKYDEKLKKYQKALQDLDATYTIRIVNSKASYKLVNDKWKMLSAHIRKSIQNPKVPFLLKVATLEKKEKEMLQGIRNEKLLDFMSQPDNFEEIISDDEPKQDVKHSRQNRKHYSPRTYYRPKSSVMKEPGPTGLLLYPLPSHTYEDLLCKYMLNNDL